jgi:hypothetical protein
MMRDKTAENFCRYFVEEWAAVHSDLPPRSPVIWAYLDKNLQAYIDSVQQPRFERRGYVPVPKAPPHGGSPVVFDKAANCHYSTVDGVKLWYSYDTEGDLQWHEKIRPDAAAAQLKEWREQRDRARNYRNLSRGL